MFLRFLLSDIIIFKQNHASILQYWFYEINIKIWGQINKSGGGVSQLVAQNFNVRKTNTVQIYYDIELELDE